uniref:Uncharacterized protein n=1 Tax=Plectus sambesii TaxID=2011161 RepID=A0A914WK87_9BILA
MSNGYNYDDLRNNDGFSNHGLLFINNHCHRVRNVYKNNHNPLFHRFKYINHKNINYTYYNVTDINDVKHENNVNNLYEYKKTNSNKQYSYLNNINDIYKNFNKFNNIIHNN